MDSNTAVVFLGLIALALLVQTAMLVGMAIAARTAVKRLAALERTVEDDVRPTLAHVKRITGNAEVISRHLVEEVPRLQSALQDATANIHRVSRMIDVVENLVLRPLGPLAKGLAVFQGVRKGLSVLRSRSDSNLLSSGRHS
jgi:hypothetical protein